MTHPNQDAPKSGEEEPWVLVPREPTEEMRRACWRAQYVFHGGTPEEAAALAEEKVQDAEQRANDEDGYRAMLAAAPPPAPKSGDSGWQTMETAPKDQTILAYGLLEPHPETRGLYGSLDRPVRAVCWWDEIDEAWCPSGSTWAGPWLKPTHWMPLPEPPVSQALGEDQGGEG